MTPAKPKLLDHLEAEVDAADEPVTVQLAGTAVRVLPVMQWRSSAVRALHAGDFDQWAESSLADDGYAQWRKVDPTLAEVEDFFEAWGEVSGQSAGESRASRRSARSTARR